jgi:hypothetical protein
MRNVNPQNRRAARTDAARPTGAASKPAPHGPAGSAPDNDVSFLATAEHEFHLHIREQQEDI